MAAYLPLFFDTQFLSDAALAAATYKLYSYESGTTTPKATYTSAVGNVANANPMELNSAARQNLFLATGGYSFELKTPAGALVKRWDSVSTGQDVITTFVADLSDTTTSTKGAGMVGYGGHSVAYASGSIGHKLNMTVYVTDPDFGAVGDGVTDDTAALQTAVDYAESIIGTALDNDLGVEIYLPTGKYKVTAKINISKAGISFCGPQGPRGAIIVASSTVFDVGQYDDSYRLRAFSLRNITFYTSVTTGTFAAIKLYRTLNPVIADCQFVNFSIDLDCYRVSQARISGLTSTKPNRTVTGVASIRLQGLDETDTFTGLAYSPGGGNHIVDCEFAGSSSTVDTAAGIQVLSSDGLYMMNCHFIGFQDALALVPEASAENYVIIDIKVINCYFDEPSTFSSGSTCITLGGTVKSTITRGVGTGTSVYRGISVQNCLLRGNYEALYCYFLRIEDGDSWFDDANQTLEDLIITGSTLRQSRSRAIQITGAGSGAYVEPRNIIIANNVFDDNNYDGVTGSASDIGVAAEQVTITGNSFGPFKTAGSDYIVLISSLDAGATDNANPSAVVVGNNFGKCTLPAIQTLQISQSETGSNTVEANNLFPGTGKQVNEVYKLTTLGATGTDIWTYAIPEGTSGVADVYLSGSSSDGADVVVYSWRVGFRRNAGGSSLSSGTTDWSAITAWNPDAFGTPPTATLATNTLKVTVTGIAATTINWALQVRLSLSR